MIKKIIVTALVVILAGAGLVGLYDAYQGNSSFAMPALSFNQFGAGPGQGQGRMGQGQGRMGQGQGGWAQGQVAQGQGQPVEHDWVTLSGTVVASDLQGLMVDTAEYGQVTLQLGPPGFAAQQEVSFSAGDTVSILGFEGQNGFFEAGEITNETTGLSLLLRDPNGRPLWAGRGRGQGQMGQQGSGGWAQSQDQTGQTWSQTQPPAEASGPVQSDILAVATEWQTLTGSVISADQQSLLVDTAERGELLLLLGRPGFADQQEVSFSAGDTVSILGFDGQNGLFQPGEITNQTTGSSYSPTA